MSVGSSQAQADEFMNNSDLSSLVSELNNVKEDVRITFAGLNSEQLNWKPSASEWSIGQCLDHLIITNGLFIPTLNQIIKGEKRKTFWESLPVLPRLFGSLVIYAANPATGTKFKAPKRVVPSSSAVDAQIVDSFVRHQDELMEKIKATDNIDARRVRVTSPLAKFVAYSLLDAYTIMVFHEKRHVQQARRVLSVNGYPR